LVHALDRCRYGNYCGLPFQSYVQMELARVSLWAPIFAADDETAPKVPFSGSRIIRAGAVTGSLFMGIELQRPLVPV